MLERLRDRFPLWLLTGCLFVACAVVGMALGGVVAVLLALAAR